MPSVLCGQMPDLAAILNASRMAVFRAIAVVLSGLALYHPNGRAADGLKGFLPCGPNCGASGIPPASGPSRDEMQL